MREVKAELLRKGDLIYYEDAYFVVLDNELHGRFAKSIPHVYIKCYMSPTIGHAIGSCEYIRLDDKVLLLVRGVELLDEGSKGGES